MLRKSLACELSGVHITKRDTEPGDRSGEKRRGREGREWSREKDINFLYYLLKFNINLTNFSHFYFARNTG